VICFPSLFVIKKQIGREDKVKAKKNEQEFKPEELANLVRIFKCDHFIRAFRRLVISIYSLERRSFFLLSLGRRGTGSADTTFDGDKELIDPSHFVPDFFARLHDKNLVDV
jgi:hypothetical protein